MVKEGQVEWPRDLQPQIKRIDRSSPGLYLTRPRVAFDRIEAA